MYMYESYPQERTGEPIEFFGEAHFNLDLGGYDPEGQIVDAICAFFVEQDIDPAHLVFRGYSADEPDMHPFQMNGFYAAAITGVNQRYDTPHDAEDPIDYALEAWMAEERPAIAVYDRRMLEETGVMYYEAADVSQALKGVFFLEN